VPEYVFRIVGFVLFVPFVQVRKYWRKRILDHLKQKPIIERKPTREKWLLAILSVSMLPLFVWFFSSWVDFAHVAVPEWVRWIGAVIFAAGIWYFWQSHVALAQNWTPVLEVREGNTLVTSGPYRFVRHPMYSASFVVDIGISLLCANWLVASTLMAGMTIMYAVRVKDEEQMMLDSFGEEYRTYMESTGRIVPKLSALLGRG